MTEHEPPAAQGPPFSFLRSLKIGSFHIGSSITDVLLSGIWNRVLISDLGVVAWPVGLLLALRYFLAPLGIWAGHLSDTRPILGSRRVVYIWLGRLMMLLSLPLLPLSLVAIAGESGSALGWTLAVVSLLLFGTGTSFSGPPYLALVHDSAPYERRGQAVSIVQFMLVVSFAFIPAFFAQLLPAYDPAAFWRLVLVSMAGAAFFWVVSIAGEERRARRYSGDVAAEQAGIDGQAPPISAALSSIWSDPRTRRYAVFLGASAFFAFMQDAMLEPFGGDVFGLPAGATTRFNAYWGIGVLIAMVGTYGITRRRRPDQQVNTTAWGLGLLAAPLILLSFASLQEMETLIMPVLIAFGVGFGIFTVGGVSLLMAMSTAEMAGSYLAVWSVVQLIFRGLGIAGGSIIRDLALTASGQFSVAYGAVFLVEALGLLACILLLRRVDIRGFAAEHGAGRSPEALASLAD